MLRLAGQLSSKKVFCRLCPSLEALGIVPDLYPLYNSSLLFIAPAQYSAGIPLKVIDAAAHGLPVVCSRLLARQLGWRNSEEVMTAETPEEYADICRELYRKYEFR